MLNISLNNSKCGKNLWHTGVTVENNPKHLEIPSFVTCYFVFEITCEFIFILQRKTGVHLLSYILFDAMCSNDLDLIKCPEN